jgi:hypothetical protein
LLNYLKNKIMAVITGAAIAAGTAAYSISQSVKAAKEKKAAARAIDAQKAPELTNAGEGLQVSTLGSDLRREEQGRTAANQVQAAQEAGARGVIGSVGKIAAGNQRVNAETAADLDKQQKEIDYFKAQDQANIRNTEEQRFRDKLAALSSQYNSANQMQQQSTANAVSAIGSGLGQYAASQGTSNLPPGGSGAPVTTSGAKGFQSTPNMFQSTNGFVAPTTKYSFPNSVSNINYGNTDYAKRYLY